MRIFLSAWSGERIVRSPIRTALAGWHIGHWIVLGRNESRSNEIAAGDLHSNGAGSGTRFSSTASRLRTVAGGGDRCYGGGVEKEKLGVGETEDGKKTI